MVVLGAELGHLGHAQGAQAADAAVKPLTAGALYTEPAGAPHFAFTRAEGAVVRLTGIGPSDTHDLPTATAR